ncbi:unnamed protein product, partial [Oppiella nova]
MKSRRIERKNARKEKKMRRNLHSLRKSNKTPEDVVQDMTPAVEPKNHKMEAKDDIKKDRKVKPKANKRQLTLREKRDIEREEKEVKRLEKKLKLNRRKKNGKRVTTLPKSFKEDGLGYILELFDENNDNKFDKESDSESNAKDLDEVNDSDNFDNESDVDEEVEDEDMESEDMQSDDNLGEESEEESETEEKEKKTTNELKEDIYGFIRDGSGNIVKQSPDLKKPIDSSVSNQLLRQMRGALNRLTVNNVMTISSQIRQMFEQNSRHDVNEALFTCIKMGGHAIHSLVVIFDDLLKQMSTNETKRMDNLVLLIVNLYVCGLIDLSLIYEILMKFCDNFTEKCIELINLILKSVGFILRKDSAIKMKEFIVRVQNEAKNVDKNSLSGTRITFLLDSLMAIKNNNMTKFKGYGTEVDVKLIENTLKSTIKKSRVHSMSGSCEAILKSSHWYSFTQNFDAINLDKKQTNFNFNKTVDSQTNERLVKALRLNTPLRRDI